MCTQPRVYAVKHKDFNIRINSRSGGVFTALSDYVLKQGGIVYGCILTDHFKAIHIRAETKEKRDLMRGSKYVQSDLQQTYKNIKFDLNKGLLVLFSGTSCQVSGLKSYLGSQFDKLICVDIVCHGVPSPIIWDSYVKWMESKYQGTCINVDFRNKEKFGWSNHKETLVIQDGFGKKIEVDSTIYANLFYSNNITRPACHKCPYKSIYHPGDITIADYWGVDKAAPGFSDNNGVSLVLINNNTGNDLFSNIKQDIDYKECRIEDSMQEPLIRPYPIPKTRSLFWKRYNTWSFNRIVKEYGGIGKKAKIKQLHMKIKRKIHRLMRIHSMR